MVAVYERAISANPGSYATRFGQAWCLTWMRRFEDALSAVNSGIERFGRQPWLLQVLPGIYLGLGERRKAEAIVTEMEARAETSWMPHFSRAVALNYLGRTEDAMEQALLSAQANDAIGPIWFRFGDLGAIMQHPRYPELLSRIMRDMP